MTGRRPWTSFDPRSREGATIARRRAAARPPVSIHAPVRERPRQARRPDQDASCFDPRSREGATPDPRSPNGAVAVSIHAPVRERLAMLFEPHLFFRVSIHAPVRERLSSLIPSRHCSCFDPRSREGATAMPVSTTPRRWSFDPRSREGATHQPLAGPQETRVSIHAPVRERPSRSSTASTSRGFDPRSREGATACGSLRQLRLSCFDPRSREGATSM